MLTFQKNRQREKQWHLYQNYDISIVGYHLHNFISCMTLFVVRDQNRTKRCRFQRDIHNFLIQELSITFKKI